MVELAPAGKSDDGAGLHIGRRGLGIGDHRRREIGLDHLGVGHSLGSDLGGNGHGVSPGRRILQSARQIACTYFEQLASKLHTIWSCPGRGCARFLPAPTSRAMNAKTAFDLIFRNALTRSSATPVDIGVSGGRIAAIEPQLACEAPRSTSAACSPCPASSTPTSISTRPACSAAAATTMAAWRRPSPRSPP